MELLESYCLHWKRSPAGVRPSVPGLSHHPEDFHHSGPWSCLDRDLGASLPAGLGKERKLRGQELTPRRSSLDRLAREGTCQDWASERRKPSSRGKIPLTSNKLCPCTAAFPGSLPQMWACEKLQPPGPQHPGIFKTGPAEGWDLSQWLMGTIRGALLFPVFCEVSWKRRSHAWFPSILASLKKKVCLQKYLPPSLLCPIQI